jgi:signal transduction histidine kinase/CheY-like chemotaxis protein
MKVEANPSKPILIVDDEEQYLASVSIALRLAGYDNVFLCSDSRTVKGLLAASPYSLVLLDLNMPHRSGIEVLEDIRSVQADVPVIIVSASTSMEGAAAGAAGGVCDYLVKPVDRNNLLAAIRRALGGGRADPRKRLFKDILLADGFDHEDQPRPEEHWTNGLWLLEAAREEYRSLFNRLPIPYFLMSMDSRKIRYANQAFCAFFGSAGCDVPFFSLLDEPYRSQIEKELTDNHHVSGRLISGRTPMGERFTVVTTLRYSETEGYIHGSFIDVSAKQAAEEESALSRRMEALGRLAGGVAHDFSNILHIISGYASLLNDAPELPEEARSSVQQILRASRNGSDIAWQLLSIGKKKGPALMRIDLHGLIRDIEPMLGAMLGPTVSLESRLNAADPVIEAEPGQMEQVLLNLVINARDSMPDGGTIVLDTSTLAGSLKPNEILVLEVKDTGVGMKPGVKERIFEPFFTTKEDGTGLGLATVYGIVKSCGGRIEVDSEPGAGTAFRIFFIQGGPDKPDPRT